MCRVLHPPKAPQEDEAPSHLLSACPLDALRHHFQLPVVWPFWIQTELLHLLLKSPLDGCAPATPPKVASSWLTWGRAPVHHPHLKQVKPSGHSHQDTAVEMLWLLNSLPATWLGITNMLPQWQHGVQVEGCVHTERENFFTCHADAQILSRGVYIESYKCLKSLPASFTVSLYHRQLKTTNNVAARYLRWRVSSWKLDGCMLAYGGGISFSSSTVSGRSLA